MIRHVILADSGPDVYTAERHTVQQDEEGRTHFDKYAAEKFAKELAAMGKTVAIYMEIARVHPGAPVKEDPR